MRELPRALMPWSASLDLFPRELADALGPLVRRLDAAVGPLRASARPGAGEPDGFDGLTRRGNYERLLLSEWLLAEEMPEEFARRAAMSEHAFLHLARIEPKGGLSAAALFDAGPNQLGTPRIAQIAALIVLSRRAEAAGARFRWGILQQSEAELQTEVSAPTLARLLSARTAKEAADTDVLRWRDALTPSDAAVPADLWLIGGPRLADFPASIGAAHLRLTDPLEPDSREVRAVIRDGNARVRPEIALPLPPEAECARLLRDPFRAAVPAPRRVPGQDSKITALAFSSDGAKLMARRDEETLLVWAIPNSPRAGVGNAKQYYAKPFAPIRAAGRTGKGYALVTTTDQPECLHIHRVGAQKGKFAVLPFLLPPGVFLSAPDGTLPPCFYFPDAEEPMRWMVLAGGWLLRPYIDENSPAVNQAVSHMGDVIAWGVSGDDLVFVGRGGGGYGGWSVRVFSPNGVMQVKRDLPTARKAFCGYWNNVAIEETPGNWRLCNMLLEEKHDVYVRQALPGTVVGTASQHFPDCEEDRENYDGKPCLVLLDANRRQLTLFAQSGQTPLPLAPSPIAEVTVCQAKALIACRLETGEILVYSGRDCSLLMRIEP